MKFAELDEVEKALWRKTKQYCNLQQEILLVEEPSKLAYKHPYCDEITQRERTYISFEREAKDLYLEISALKVILNHDSNKEDLCQN